MQYCNHCGAQQEDGALFCSSCGAKLNPVHNPGGATPHATPAGQDYYGVKTQVGQSNGTPWNSTQISGAPVHKKRKTWLVVLIIVLSVLLLAGGGAAAWFLLVDKQDSSYAVEDDTQDYERDYDAEEAEEEDYEQIVPSEESQRALATITGYVVTEQDGESCIMAQLSNGEQEQTDITLFSSVKGKVEIFATGDYNGNGNAEAVVGIRTTDDDPENMPCVLYYDRTLKVYNLTGQFDSHAKVVAEKRNGATHLVQRYGVREDRYEFDGNMLMKREAVSHAPGIVIKRWTCRQLFQYSNDMETGTAVSFDIDDNGYDDRFAFWHGTSREYMNGERMQLTTIDRSYNDAVDCAAMPYAQDFAILSTIGREEMHDMLLDNAYLYRWDGSAYREWIWNGTDIVKKR